MVLAERKTLVFGVAIAFACFVIIPRETSALADEKLRKNNFKTVKDSRWVEKKWQNKEHRRQDEGSDVGTIEGKKEEPREATARSVEFIESNLMTEDVHGKGHYFHDRIPLKIEENKRDRGYLNRLKRNATFIANKNYKKLKLAETKAGYKSLLNKDYAKSRKVNENNEDINYFSKKKMTRRRAIYPAKMVRLASGIGNDLRISRTKRYAVSSDKRFLRVNATDYYAQRKAVMDRFYARQREIAEKYAKQTTNTPRNLFKYHLKTDLESKNSSSSSGIEKQDPLPQETVAISVENNELNLDADKNHSTTTEGSLEEFSRTTSISSVFKDDLNPGAATYSSRNSSNVEREAPDYNPSSSNCENAPLSGPFLPKNRKKGNGNCNDGKRGYRNSPNDESTGPRDEDSGTENERWGECTGKVVYQHNLLLGLKGPSNLDAVFEVIIQGPVCITCVEAMRYNKTRATVSLHSGGRGYDFAKLKLKGFENEGFSYIVKVWGVKKIDDDCDDI